MKAKDAESIPPRAWAFLRNVLRGHMQTQRESCDHPTALPTVSVFSCHSLSHASPAKHRTPSPVISPLSPPPTLKPRSSLDALLDFFYPLLVVLFSLTQVLFYSLLALNSEVKDEQVLSGWWHSFTASALPRLTQKLK